MQLLKLEIPNLVNNAFIVLKAKHIYWEAADPSGLAGPRRGSVTARPLRLQVRIPPGACVFFRCDCCVLLGRGLCVGLITRPQESYRL